MNEDVLTIALISAMKKRKIKGVTVLTLAREKQKIKEDCSLEVRRIQCSPRSKKEKRIAYECAYKKRDKKLRALN